MRSNDALYVEHMLDMARKVAIKIADLARSDYDADENLRLAITHLIQIIGEAASRVSIETRLAHPEIPWRAITGMRHRIVHDYLNTDEDVVWQVAVDDLPGLIILLEPLIF